MGGANSPYLDSLYQATAYTSGVKVGTSALFNFDADTIDITYNETTKRFDIAAKSSTAGVLAALADATAPVVIPRPAAGSAALVVGDETLTTGAAQTVGAVTETICALPFADPYAASIQAHAFGVDIGTGLTYWFDVNSGGVQVSGSATYFGGALTPTIVDNITGGVIIELVYGGGYLSLAATGKAAHTIDWSGSLRIVAGSP